MKSGITILGLFLIIGTAFFMFARISETMLYPTYRGLYDYRRITPELLPSSETLHVLSVGHDTTYADVLWVGLVQSIGDNIGNNKYLDFSHLILKNITSLSPYFTYAYQTDLLFTPLVYADSQSGITLDDRNKIERAIEHGKEGMKIFCDQDKINTISSLPYGKELWKRDDLRNPCLSGMVPYYIGFHYANDFEEGKEASYYYKIASMQDNAPRSTEFLGPIALANTTSPLDAAVSFFLIAQDGYDKEPYQCRTFVRSILSDLKNKREIDEKWITQIQKEEKFLKDPKIEKNFESLGVDNCYDYTLRGMKQLFVSYIAEKSQGYPDILDARDLVKQGIIPKIPTIASQAGYTLRKREGKWYFRNY